MFRGKVFAALAALIVFVCVPCVCTACLPGSSSVESNGSGTGEDKNDGDGIPPNHVHNAAHTAAEKPTCTEGGNVEYWFCAGCGKYFSDGDCTNEISFADTLIAPDGHTPVKDEAVEADCVHTGLSEGSHCGVCGEILSDRTVIGVIPHDFVSGKCSRCGEWEISDGLDYISFGDGYAVSGIGVCTAEYIRIPAVYKEKPVLKIADGAFADNGRIKGVSIPDSVQTVGEGAFESCENLEEVYTGDGVTYIGLSAFARCKNLKTVTLSASLQSLNALVFNECISLEEIDVPASVAKICADAFFGCAGLERVILHVGLTEIEKEAFNGCTALAEVIFYGTEEEWNEVLNATDGYAVRFIDKKIARG